MTKLSQLQTAFEALANPQQAEKMTAYIRHLFPFYGVRATDRRQLYKAIIAADKKNKVLDWDLLEAAWAKKTRQLLLDWACSDDCWLRRTAIIHQLGRKGQTDSELLAHIITLNLGQTEFFINKAIGWALRDYARHNPDWVKHFVADHRDQLAPLSIKEAMKHLGE